MIWVVEDKYPSKEWMPSGEIFYTKSDATNEMHRLKAEIVTYESVAYRVKKYIRG